jgi:hypothetical protein
MTDHRRAAVPCINHRFLRQFWGWRLTHEGGVDTNADISDHSVTRDWRVVSLRTKAWE